MQILQVAEDSGLWWLRTCSCRHVAPCGVRGILIVVLSGKRQLCWHPN